MFRHAVASPAGIPIGVYEILRFDIDKVKMDQKEELKSQ